MAPKKSKAQKSKYDILMCRICLTVDSSQKNVDLTDPLHNDNNTLLVFEALEEVMGEKIMKLEGFSNCICVICHSLLKMAYDLKKQYYKNQKSLSKNIVQPRKGFVFFKSQRESLKEAIENETNANEAESDKKNRRSLRERKGQNKAGKGNFGPDKITSNNESNLKSLKSQLNKDKKPLIKIIIESDSDAESNNKVPNEVDNTDPLEDNNAEEYVEIKIEDIENDNGLESNDDGASEENSLESNNDLKSHKKSNGLMSNNKAATVAENTNCLKNTFMCCYCRHSYTGVDISKHMEICSKIIKNTCYICDKQLGDLELLLNHLQTEHSIGNNLSVPEKMETEETEIDNENIQPPKEYICKTCGTVKHSQSALSYHRQKCIKGKSYKCDECSKSFMFPYVLKMHQRTHGKFRKVIDMCPICAKTFHYRKGLESHMRVHTKEQKYQCKFCGKRFIYLYSLTEHERVHTGEKPFVCRFCDKRFTRYSERTLHERRIHTGERPIKCKICEKGFQTCDNLKVHMCQHGGSYECHICQKGFVSKDILKFHLKRKHKVEVDRTDLDQIKLKNIEEELVAEPTEKPSQESDQEENNKSVVEAIITFFGTS